MIKTFSTLHVREHLDSVLREAESSGETRILRDDGLSFVVRPLECLHEEPMTLEERLRGLPVVDLGFKNDQEIVDVIRQSREYVPPWLKEMMAGKKRRKHLQSAKGKKRTTRAARKAAASKR